MGILEIMLLLLYSGAQYSKSVTKPDVSSGKALFLLREVTL